MEVYHGKLMQKSGGRGAHRKKFADKVRCHVGGHFVGTKIGEKKVSIKRIRGGNSKASMVQNNLVNLVTKEGTKKIKILNVLETPSNRHYARKGIITKGAIIETEMGKAKVTSRPAQHGMLNAVLLEEKK